MVRLRGVARAVAVLVGIIAVSPWEAHAQEFSTTVRADARHTEDASSVGVIDLPLPGQPGAASAARSTLADVLAGQPGVTLRSAAGLGQWSGALLRGADATQVALFIDGVPLPRAGQAAIDLSTLPIDAVERIEIYRGMPPLELGMDAVGGAIHLRTRKGRGRPLLYAQLGSGAFGLRTVSMGRLAESAGLRTAVSAQYRGASGDFPYLSTGGLELGTTLVELLRRNDDHDQLSIDLRVARDTPTAGFSVFGQSFFKRQGIPGIGQAAAQPGRPRLQVLRGMLSASGYRTFFDQRLRLESQAHVLVESSSLSDADLYPPAAYEQLTAQAGVRTALYLSPRPPASGPPPPLRFSAILDLRYEHALSSDLCPAPRVLCPGIRPTQSGRLRAQLSLGGELRKSGDVLLVQPALSLLVATSRLLPLPDSPARDLPIESQAIFVAPRVAARVRLTQHALLRIGAGRFVRLPTFLELFGDRAFFRPSLDLRPESSWSIEVGARWQRSLAGWVDATFETHAFGRQIEDLIDLTRDGNTLRARNVGEAKTAGVEAELLLRLRTFASLRAVYTFLHARDETLLPGRAGNQLPSRPPHALFARLELTGFSLHLGYELDLRDALFLDPANLRPRPLRLLHGASLQVGPLSALRLALAIEVKNLFDTRQTIVTRVRPSPLPPEQALAPLSDLYDYPLPGRALYATLSGQFL